MNFAETPARHARLRPSHPAIRDGARAISYAELEQLVRGAGHSLLESGVETGEVVAIMLPDGPEHLVASLALARIGAVMLSLPPTLAGPELDTATDGLAVRRAILERGTAPPAGLTALTLDPVGAGPTRQAPDLPVAPVDRDHPLLVRQSSGTTGRPKTLFWSHGYVRGRLPAFEARQGFSADDRLLPVLPLSFAYSRDLCLYLFQFGGTVVINRTEGLAELIQTMRRERITQATLTPAHLRALLRVKSDRWPLFPALRSLLSTSSALTVAERLAVHERVTPNVLDGYGTNEIGLITAAGPDERARFPDSVGTPVPGLEIRVVDGTGDPVAPDEVGLVCLRCPGMATGYLNDPEATARHFRDGWFYTGDLGSMNQDGYLFFKGRADDAINNQGVKFYPLEVEQLLQEHPAVTEAAVFGWPHPALGETAVACVVAEKEIAIQDIQRFCSGRIAGHKLPTAVYTLNKLPKTRSGKVQKRVLKDLLRDRLARDLA